MNLKLIFLLALRSFSVVGLFFIANLKAEEHAVAAPKTFLERLDAVNPQKDLHKLIQSYLISDSLIGSPELFAATEPEVIDYGDQILSNKIVSFYFMVTCLQKSVKILNLETGLVLTLPNPNKHDEVVISPNKKFIAIWSKSSKHATLYNNDQHYIGSRTHNAPITSVVLKNDFFLTTSMDNTAQIRKLTQRTINSINHDSPVIKGTIHNDLAITLSDDGIAKVTNTNTNELARTINNACDIVNNLIITLQNGTLNIIDASTGNSLYTFTELYLKFSYTIKTGFLITKALGTYFITNLKTFETKKIKSSETASINVCIDKLIIWIKNNLSQYKLIVVDYNTMESLFTFDVVDTSYLLWDNVSGILLFKNKNYAKVLNMKTGQVTHTIYHDDVITSVIGNKDLYVTTSKDNIIKITDLSTIKAKQLTLTQFKLISWLYAQQSFNKFKTSRQQLSCFKLCANRLMSFIYTQAQTGLPITLNNEQTLIFESLPAKMQNALSKNYNLEFTKQDHNKEN